MTEHHTYITSPDHPHGPYLVETVYPSEQVIIANVIATHHPFDADPTGERDSTAAIQAALDACYAMGGGTVFLPVGHYLVTDTVRIPYGVVLQGDWQDPDTVDEPAYGTVILARPRPLESAVLGDPTEGVLFELMHEGDGNNGLIGLTVFYPEQDIHAVKRYGYTVYGDRPRMVMLRDLTFLNSYQGIGACLGKDGTHELLQVENVRMTVLTMGYKAKRSREVGYTRSLTVSPRYWAQAAEAFACTDPVALRDYCRANTIGIEFESLDLNQYTNIVIESCHTALLSCTGFWGTFYGVDIRDCVYGLVAQDVCGVNGILLANATIEADKYAVANYAVRQGGIKLAGVKATGGGGFACVNGAHIETDEIGRFYPSLLGSKGPLVRVAMRLFVADIERLDGQTVDAAPAIQAALDGAAATGGIVYLPHGVYHVYSPLTVPTGVELRGAMPMPVRDKGAAEGLIPGTVLLSYVDDGDFITLSDRSGIQGVRIFYPAYDATTALELLKTGDGVVDRCVAIRGRGAYVYAKNVVVSGAMVGIDFTGCDVHSIERAFGCAFHRFIRAGGVMGSIGCVLCNMTFTTRQPFVVRGMYDPARCNAERWQLHGYETAQSFTIIRDLVLRSYCDTVELIDAEEETLDNVFMYGCRRMLRTTRSIATCSNVTSDWQSGESMFLVGDYSTVVAFNPLRTSGRSHECDGTSSLTVYNRIVNSDISEPTLRVSPRRARTDLTPGYEMERVELFSTESTDGIEGVTLNTDPSYIKKGSASLKHEGEGSLVFDAHFAPVDATVLGVGAKCLHMSVWIEHTIHHVWNDRSRITLTDRSGKGTVFEWSTTSFVTAPGWNELYLPLHSGLSGVQTNASIAALSELRMTLAYNGLGIYPDVYIDDVYMCTIDLHPTTTEDVDSSDMEDYVMPDPVTVEHPTRILIEDGETLAHVISAAARNTDPAFVKEGSASIRSLTEDQVKLELRFPDTDATEYKDYGFLHMWLYVEDVAEIGAGGQIELCSGGDKDAGERFWTTTSYVKHSGWNELWLPIHRSAISGAKPPHDPSHINYIRVYTSSRRTPAMYFDDIYLCNKADASVYDASNTRHVGWQKETDGASEG